MDAVSPASLWNKRVALTDHASILCPLSYGYNSTSSLFLTRRDRKGGERNGEQCQQYGGVCNKSAVEPLLQGRFSSPLLPVQNFQAPMLLVVSSSYDNGPIHMLTGRDPPLWGPDRIGLLNWWRWTALRSWAECRWTSWLLVLLLSFVFHWLFSQHISSFLKRFCNFFFFPVSPLESWFWLSVTWLICGNSCSVHGLLTQAV